MADVAVLTSSTTSSPTTPSAAAAAAALLPSPTTTTTTSSSSSSFPVCPGAAPGAVFAPTSPQLPPLPPPAALAGGGGGGGCGQSQHAPSSEASPAPSSPTRTAGAESLSRILTGHLISKRQSSSSLAVNSARSSRSVRRHDSNVPEIIVFPPEEDFDEPSISYAPNDLLSGLPNPGKTRVVSLLNATLQLFIALPEITEELPVASANDSIQQFVATVMRLHCEAEKIASPDMLELDWWREIAGLPSADAAKDDLPHGSDESDCSPRTLSTSSSDDSFEAVENYERVASALIDEILLPCRIGRRFRSEKIGSHNSLNGSSPTISSDSLSPSTHLLSIPLDAYSESETVGLIALIHEALGIPQPRPFYFGGRTSPAPGVSSTTSSSPFRPGSIFANVSISDSPRPPPSLSTTSRPRSPTRSSPLAPKPDPATAPKPKTMFTDLPALLTISFRRGSSSGAPETFHRTAVELPMDIDLGFALDARGPRRRPVDNTSGLTKKHAPSTFYRLHGFATQTGGRFLTYTRLRGGNTWYKCEDETVTEADLGARVSSKGVVMALYRLQIAAKR
ncbi:hypothetical protein DFJ73DRAFT_658902 [Zopfochytrium polystomum]|nr:hypothetical protein DFJ73DRAFT_658902 [Zopfochytrium polystomum]